MNREMSEGTQAGASLGATTVELKAKVLLVDDEPVTARSYARSLSAAGYRVTIANDGREAAALAKGEPFDVVVSDIAMPDMDGLALLRAIRQSDLDVPMVFMTGSPALESAVQAIEYGAFRYLLKPVAPAALLDVVERAARVHRLAKVRREAVLVRELEGKPIGDRAGLEARFASALDKLWVAAQPIVSWSGRRIFAYETLLRTDEPTLRSPLDFFDAAERLGRLPELGRIIRRQVANIMKDADAPVFVNLHPSDLEDAELYADDGALTPYAKNVVLEITERAALDRIHELQQRVTRLRRPRVPHRHRRSGRRVRGPHELRAARAGGRQGRHVARARHRQLGRQAEARAVDHRPLHGARHPPHRGGHRDARRTRHARHVGRGPVPRLPLRPSRPRLPQASLLARSL